MLDIRCTKYQGTDSPEGLERPEELAGQRADNPEGLEGRGDKPDSIRRNKQTKTNKQTKLCADATGRAEPCRKKESGEREDFYRNL